MKTCTITQTDTYGTWHAEIIVSYRNKTLFSKTALYGAEKANMELMPEIIEKIKLHKFNFTHYKFAGNESTKYKLENK